MKKFRIIASALLVAALGLVGCDKDKDQDGSDNNTQETTAGVVSVSVTSSSGTTLYVGDTIKLTSKVQITGVVAKTVSWSSSDEDVATVDNTGKVTALSAGPVTITATSKADTSKSGSITLTVIKGEWPANIQAEMNDALGTVLPFVQGTWEWADMTDDGYGYVGMSEDSTLAKVKAAYSAEGFDFDQETDEYGDLIYYFTSDIEGNDDYYLYVMAYDYEGIYIQAYLQPVEYEEWPAEKISQFLTEIGLDVTSPIPSISGEGYYYIISTIQVAQVEEPTEEDLIDALSIEVVDGENGALVPSDYAAVLETSGLYNVTLEEEYGYEYVTGSAKDKSHTLYVQSNYYEDGIEIWVMPYMPDIWVEVSNTFELLEVNNVENNTAQIDVQFGVDVDLSKVTITSSNIEVATVTNDGLITAVGEGNATITVSYEEISVTVDVVVVTELPTEFTVEQVAVFKDNIHNIDGVVIPFDSLFNRVEYNEELDIVEISGYPTNYEHVLEYYDALVAAGWVDTYRSSEEYQMSLELMQTLAELFGVTITEDEFVEMIFEENGFALEKEVTDGVNTYFVDMEIMLLDEEGYCALEGDLFVAVYDPYIYDKAEAYSGLATFIAQGLEVETEVEFPQFEGSHYALSFEEADEFYDEPAWVILQVYDFADDLAAVKTAMEGKGFTAEIIEELDETSSDVYLTYVSFISEDELLKGQVILDSNGVLLLQITPYVAGAATSTFDFTAGIDTDQNANTITMQQGKVTVVASKAKGQSAPAYNNGEIRLYDANTLTVSSTEGALKTLDFNICNCTSKVGANFTADSGTITATDYGFHWEGDAETVTFTCAKVDSNQKQIHFTSLVVNGQAN